MSEKYELLKPAIMKWRDKNNDKYNEYMKNYMKAKYKNNYEKNKEKLLARKRELYKLKSDAIRSQKNNINQPI